MPFDHEPREWFRGRHVVMFSMKDPDLVMHRPSKRCPEEIPHEMRKCGEFKEIRNAAH
jgi:hypothetical protein